MSRNREGAPELIGHRVGRYEIVDELGRGGMGVVYKARDVELARHVALKALPLDRAADPERRKRFLQEARSASRLSHPGIIAIHDILSEQETDWIVMELIDGEPLDALIPPGGLPVERAVAWAAEIADALAVAHTAGIVHRDLKPSNVMLDPSGRLRVLDFGLAKLASEEDLVTGALTPSAPLTRAGTVLGTVDYMSPEQAMGRSIDGRSDVFSLGAMLFEMLTGRRPFERENLPSRIHAVAYEDPPEPRSLRPDLPDAVTEVVGRALEKDREDRYQSMEEMAAALRDAVGVGAVSGAAGPAEPKAGRRRSRRILLVASGAALIVALVAWSIGNWPWGSLRPVEPVVETELTAGAGDRLPVTPYQLLQQGEERLAAYWRSGYVDQAVDRLQRAVDIDPSYAPAYAALAEAYLRVHSRDRDPVWLTRAGAQAERALELDPNLAVAHLRQGQVLLARGDVDGAAKEFQEVSARDPENVAVTRGLADVAAARGDEESAEELYRKAVERAPGNPEVFSALGTFLYGAGRYEEAADAFAQSTEVADDFVFGYRNRAAALHMLGRYGAASDTLQKALTLRPDAAAYSNLGTLYFFQGLYPQALQAYERAIDLGANDYVVWGNLGDAYRWTPGRQEDARRAYARALQLLDGEGAPQGDELTFESRRALLLAKKGDAGEAADAADRLFATTDDGAALYRLALAYELAGRRSSALQALAKAVENGYPSTEIEQDPELTELRADPKYHLMMVDEEAASSK